MNNWPPIKGKLISVKKTNDETIFVGKVSKKLLNGKAMLILLMNNNEYIDDELNNIKSLGYNHKGLLVLYPHYPWNYVDYNFNNKDIVYHINNVAKGYNYFKKMYLQ